MTAPAILPEALAQAREAWPECSSLVNNVEPWCDYAARMDARVDAEHKVCKLHAAIARLIEETWDEALEAAAALVEETGAIYAEDIFRPVTLADTKPLPDNLSDRIAAQQGRHVSRLWSHDIRALRRGAR